MNPSPLTEKVIEHQKTGSGHAALMKEIVQEVLRHKQSYGFTCREDAYEALSLYYPRISSLIRRFSGDGRAFEAFLCSSLKFFQKSVECKKRENALRERELWQRSEYCQAEEGIGEWRSREDPIARLAVPGGLDALIVDARRSASRDSIRKRLLFLGMKCAFSISESQIEALSGLVDISVGHLRCRLEFLREKAESRLRRQEKCIAMRNKLYASLCFKERLLQEELREDRRVVLRMAVERIQVRLANCRERLAAIQLAPTNAEIAIALGVAKGTVDSGLFYLKRQSEVLRS